MQLGVFAVMVGVAVYATDRWAVQRVAVYPMSLLSAGLYGWLAFRGTRITSDIGGAHTGSYPYLGYIWLFLSLTCLIAIVAHYLWGLPEAGRDETESKGALADNGTTASSPSE